MSNYFHTLEKERRIYLKTLMDDLKARRNKDIFDYHGIHVYTGAQGSGKTISMVYGGYKLARKYSRLIIASNLSLKWLKPVYMPGMSNLDASPGAARAAKVDFLRGVMQDFDPTTHYIHLLDNDDVVVFLQTVRNGTGGRLLLLDEFHLYFNSTQSKDTSIEVFQQVAQLRKQATLILGSSQVFMRLEKAVREQASSIIGCDTTFGFITRQSALKAQSAALDKMGRVVGDVQKTGYFIQTREIRNLYDTRELILPASQQYESGNQIVDFENIDKLRKMQKRK